MRVREAMTQEVRIANPDQTICEAARLMAEIDAGSLPVGENDQLVGIITDRDIAIRAVAREKPLSTTVREVMSKEVLYCFDDQPVEEIAQNMAEVKVRRMPVVNREKRLVGIISVGDLAKAENPATTGQAVADITAPGGPHTQSKSQAGSKSRSREQKPAA
jgi:CBS domain-containing protein